MCLGSVTVWKEKSVAKKLHNSNKKAQNSSNGAEWLVLCGSVWPHSWVSWELHITPAT